MGPTRVNVHGHTAPGFEPVARAFEKNFSQRGDVGAAFAAYVDGEPAIDLWGGVADPSTGQPWREDTVQLIFSETKGLVATALMLLCDRGEVRLTDPVARFWAEFETAAN